MTTNNSQLFNSVLVIDDEPGIRKMLKLDLTADGFNVLTAEDGDSGLEIFDKQRPDLVLTDIKMPGMDGIEVLKRIKQKSPDTEVIVITGHGDMEIAIKSLKLEASDFITKPIISDAINVAIKRAQNRLALKAKLKAYTSDLEKKVEAASKKLVEAERLASIGQTVASVAHSIKNMLAGLRGGTYLVRQGIAQNDALVSGQGLDMVERNLRRVKSFVSDLLTLSKPRDPQLSLVEAQELAAEAIEAMSSEAKDQGVELALQGQDLGLIIKVERKAIQDALMNLLSNAIDAAALVVSGKVSIHVEKVEGSAAFKIEDNGPGLEKEAEEKIFKGFFSTKGAAGTGLGLMVAQKTAKEHGGLVDYYPGTNGGAVFRLILPLGETSSASVG